MKNKTKVKLATAEKIKMITKIQEHRDSLNMEYYNGPTPIAFFFEKSQFNYIS